MTSLQELQRWDPSPRCPDDPEPTCDILLRDPLPACQNAGLLPDHLCPEVAAYSTFSWAYERLRPVGEFADLAGTPLPVELLAWPNTHPLPIGMAALQQRADALGASVPQPHVDLLAGLAGFDDLEQAGLIISIRLPMATITFFGLAEPFVSEPDTDMGDGFFGRDSLWAYGYPRPWNNMEYRYSGHRVTVSGSGTNHADVGRVFHNLQHWWQQFVGVPLRRGRPPGSGRLLTGEEIDRKYRNFRRTHSRIPSQATMAERFGVSERHFKRELARLREGGYKYPPVVPE